MPNAFSNLGADIASILGTATNGSAKGVQGLTDGVNAGSNYALRKAQSGQADAETQKILYQLSKAQLGDNTTGVQLATAMGVPQLTAEAVTRGETTLPAVMMPDGSVPIDPGFKEKTNRANTMKILQQLAGGSIPGGNAESLGKTLQGGQEMNIRDLMMSGERQPRDIAAIQAAMKGDYPGSSGGGSTAAKVQEMGDLVQRGRARGLSKSEAEAEAMVAIYGNADAKAVDSLIQALAQSGAYVSEDIQAMIPILLGVKNQALGKEQAPNAPPGPVVKVYN